MTEPERRALRQLVSDARKQIIREQLERAGQALRCERCGEAMPAHPSRTPKRFCSDACRRYFWYHGTEQGRRNLIEKRRRQRRRKGIPRRPNAEVAL